MSAPACTTDTCPYRVLAVACHATGADISRVWKQQVRRAHPDVNADKQRAEEQTKRLNNAWDLIKSEKKREEHHKTCVTRKACQGCRTSNTGGGQSEKTATTQGRVHPIRRQQGPKPTPASATSSGNLDHEPLAFDEDGFVWGRVYCMASGVRFRVVTVGGGSVEIRRNDGQTALHESSALWASWQRWVRANAPDKAARTAGGAQPAGTPEPEASPRPSPPPPHTPPPPPPGPPPVGTAPGAFGRPRATDDSPLAWDDRTFTVGRHYANAFGVYEVVTAGDGTVDIRYTDLHVERWPRARLKEEWLAIRGARAARQRAARAAAARTVGARAAPAGAWPGTRSHHPGKALRTAVRELEHRGLLRTVDDPNAAVYYIEPSPGQDAAVEQALRPWIKRGLVRRALARERATGRSAWYAG